MELNFEGLEMQKWNIPTDRVQREDEKNGVIFLVIMFTHFLYFLLMPAKNQSQFVENIYVHLKDYLAFTENAMDC